MVDEFWIDLSTECVDRGCDDDPRRTAPAHARARSLVTARRHLRLVTSGPESETRLRVSQAPPRVSQAPPRTRGDCVDGPRPCQWIECRHHLLVERTVTGKLRPVHATLEGMADTCALDVADRGPHNDREVGALMGVTRQAVWLVEKTALEKVRGAIGYEAGDLAIADGNGETLPDDSAEDEPEAEDDPWTALAMRALGRMAYVAPAPVEDVIAALEELGGSDLLAVGRRAGMRGSPNSVRVAVWRIMTRKGGSTE